MHISRYSLLLSRLVYVLLISCVVSALPCDDDDGEAMVRLRPGAVLCGCVQKEAREELVQIKCEKRLRLVI